MKLDVFQWQMLDQEQMDRNFSLQPLRPHGYFILEKIYIIA